MIDFILNGVGAGSEIVKSICFTLNSGKVKRVYLTLIPLCEAGMHTFHVKWRSILSVLTNEDIFVGPNQSIP